MIHFMSNSLPYCCSSVSISSPDTGPGSGLPSAEASAEATLAGDPGDNPDCGWRELVGKAATESLGLDADKSATKKAKALAHGKNRKRTQKPELKPTAKWD